MKTKETTYVPFELPLYSKHYGPEGDSDVLDKEGTVIFAGLSIEQSEFIVRAVNSHEALLEAAKESLILFKHFKKSPNDFLAVELLENAIAKAEGKA